MSFLVLSASFEYLCNGSTAVIKKLILLVRDGIQTSGFDPTLDHHCHKVSCLLGHELSIDSGIADLNTRR